MPWRTGSRERPMEMPFRTQLRMTNQFLDEKTHEAIEHEMQDLIREYQPPTTTASSGMTPMHSAVTRNATSRRTLEVGV